MMALELFLAILRFIGLPLSLTLNFSHQRLGGCWSQGDIEFFPHCFTGAGPGDGEQRRSGAGT